MMRSAHRLALRIAVPASRPARRSPRRDSSDAMPSFRTDVHLSASPSRALILNGYGMSPSMALDLAICSAITAST